MSDLSRFPITSRWPAEFPDRLQYYGLPTPNGVKVSIMLEETGIPYEAHRINIMADESHSPEFLSLNPNGKIPAIIDPDGPQGEAIALAESGAILHYLAEKTGLFLPPSPQARWETLQWVYWQMGGLGPMLGQVGFFHKFAGRDYEDKRPRDRYVAEARRLLGVLDTRLTDREWIMDHAYTIADMASLGWVNNLITFYEARDLVGYADFPAVEAWRARGFDRPGVQRGITVCAAP